MSWETAAALIIAIGGWIYAVYEKSKNRQYQLEDHKRDRQEKKEDEELSLKETVEKMKTDQDEFMKKMRADQDEFIKSMTNKFSKVETTLDNLTEGEMLILRKTITDIANIYIDRGEITLHQREELHNMHSVYHFKLFGNGGLDSVMDAVDHIKVVHDDD